MNAEVRVREDLSVKVAEWLTKQSLFVDVDGNIWARYIVEIKGVTSERWHKLEDIDTAIWQHFHILEDYLGQYIGLAKTRTRLPGEERIIRGIASELLSVAQSYLNEKVPVSRQTTQDLEDYIGEVLRTIGPATNQFKEAAKIRLSQIEPSKPTELGGQVRVAGEIIPAAGELAQRVQELIGKAYGVRMRLVKLHRKRRQCLGFFVNLYRALDDIYRADQKVPMAKWDEREIQWICRKFDPDQASLMSVIKSVNVQPYSGRAKSPQIRRLRLLPKYLEPTDRSKRRYESVIKAVAEAMRKLERVIAEVDSRYQPKIAYLPRR